MNLKKLAAESTLVYLITDRQILPRDGLRAELASLIDFIEIAMAAGVDMVQVRERDLSAHNLDHLTSSVARLARRYGSRLLVNDRADVAACAGVGVHLATRSIPTEVVRKTFGPEMLIGASTHSLEEAQRAEQAGADFIVFGPVYETESKKAYGPPTGLRALRAVTASIQIPVLALGGIKMSNYRQALEAGAAGIAGISLFAVASEIKEVVRAIKG